MNSPIFNLKASKLPAISGYDVHIYFEGADGHAKANALAAAVKAAIPGVEGPFQVKAGLGPHLFANVEVAIPPEALSKVLTLLQLDNKGLSVLVHPHTGDETLDHTKLVNWVGKPVPLNLDALLPPSQRQNNTVKNNVAKFSAPKAA